MAENISEPTQKAAQQKRDEETSSGNDIVQAVVKAARGLTIYPPGSPFHKRFLGELHRKLTDHLETYGSFLLDLDHYEIRFGEEVLYENRNPKESLAFRLHADGIKSLEFREGVTDEETATFLRIINTRSSDLDDDDILTLLWSADMQHIGYTPEDDLNPAELLTLGAGSDPEQQETGIREACRAEIPPPETKPLLREEAVGIFLLTEEERLFLDKAIRYEEERNPLEGMVEIMPSILASAEDETLKMELLDLLGGIAGRLVADGKAAEALFLLRLLRDHVRNGELTETVRGKAAAVLEGIGSAPEMESPQGLLQSAGGQEAALLGEVVTLLGRGAVQPFSLLLGEELGEAAERSVVEALADVGRAAPDLFFPFLSPDNPRRAKNILVILRKTGTAAGREVLADLIEFGDGPLRKEVLLYLESLEVPGTGDLLLQMLGDESGLLRVNAARSLARRKERGALEGLTALTSTPEFRERGPAERKIIFETIGRIGGAEALPFLEKVILTKRTFSRKREKDDVACAAAGLAAVGSPAAAAVLRAAERAHKGEAKEAAARTLARMERTGAEGGEKP